jgi:DNA-binding PadR family transcriptional regulator
VGKMNHSFNISVAEEYGIEEAILLENIYFWCKKNEANKKHYKKDRYWTYNSAKALQELFPYMSEAKIYRCLKHLQKEGLILIDRFNSNGYDQTRWYAITDKAKLYYEPPILQNEKWNLQNEKSNLQKEEINCTDINTDVNTDIKTTGASSKPTPEEVFNFYHKNKLEVSPERFWELNNKKNWKNGLSKNWKKAYLEMTGTPEESYNPYLEFNAEHYGKYMGEK